MPSDPSRANEGLRPPADEQGAIPSFPPLRTDADGRILPEAEGIGRERTEALRRLFRLWERMPEVDPDGAWEAAMWALGPGPEERRRREPAGGRAV